MSIAMLVADQSNNAVVIVDNCKLVAPIAAPVLDFVGSITGALKWVAAIIVGLLVIALLVVPDRARKEILKWLGIIAVVVLIGGGIVVIIIGAIGSPC